MVFNVSPSAILTAACTGLAWVIRTERKMARMLSRTEHENICDRRQKDLTRQLASIQKTLQDQDDRSSTHRSAISAKLTAISVKIAVLQTRAGHPPTGDTGSYEGQ